jgi:23S rRNA A2030 N6-methylase RlmJ
MVGTFIIVAKSNESKTGKKIVQLILTSEELPQIEYDYLDFTEKLKLKAALTEYVGAAVLSYELISKEDTRYANRRPSK